MGYISEEEKLRRIQREAERKKKEQEMLQEEELRHIRELERIKQMSGAEEDDYDPEMDSAFVVDEPVDDRLYGDVPPQPQSQPQQYVQTPQQQSQQTPPPQYIQTPPTRRDNMPQQPVRQQQPQYAPQGQPQNRPQQPAPQYVQTPPQQPRQPQNPTRGTEPMKKPNTKPSYEDEYDDDDDGADFDVAAYRAAEREKKQRMHNRYAETEERRPKKKHKDNEYYEDAGRGDDGNGGKPNKKKKKHPIRNFFAFIFFLLLILVVAGGLVLNSILSKFKHFDSEVSQRADSMKGKQLNILLIGQDAREGEEGQRTDTMILCTVNQDNGTVVLTSFMRDMYVDIPGYGGDRINAAYSYGGVDLLDKTIEEDFGITIDGNAMVDLSSFLESMTAVGDIDMELTAEEAQYMNENPQAGTATDISDEVWDLHEGKNSLTPAQALCYARMRYVGNSDYERTERQRKLIMACVSKVKHGHPLSGIKMANGIAPCISTDLSKMGFLKMGWGFVRGGDMQSYRLPVDGYYYDDYIDGMAVLVPDMEGNRNMLEQFMSGEYKGE